MKAKKILKINITGKKINIAIFYKGKEIKKSAEKGEDLLETLDKLFKESKIELPDVRIDICNMDKYFAESVTGRIFKTMIDALKSGSATK